MTDTPRTVGVEEEFLLVDPDTAQPRAVAGAVLRGADGGGEDLTGELQREQIETGTRPCRDLGELSAELERTRERAGAAAADAGVALVASGTSPLPASPHVTGDARYERMVHRFGRTGREQLTCGCHVHVAVSSDAEGVAVLDRIRPWLAPLLALSANSPFWQGRDSGYASFRSQVWGRWPSAGPTGILGTAQGYRELEEALLGTGTVLDEGMLYFDARLSRTHPTVEIRVADVCRDPGDAVLLAGLARGLVETAGREARAGVDPDPVRTEVLRLAAWRAGRSGLDGDLVHPRTWRPAPAARVLHALVEHVSDALADADDLSEVRERVDTLLHRGTGARRQRSASAHTGDLRAVVTDVAG